ncbi:MAG: sugar ABC transporter substrate-binding protein [Treponema sp.]|jgi:multiple sugar transport system substrate-binding protein|nr:sugar ABC transporter substrate-binding protein [Treponema sp.]
MKRKQVFGGPLAGAMMAALAALVMIAGGCSKAASTGTQTVNFWYWDDLVSGDYETLVKEFEAANPGIKVQRSVTPWADYWTKLQTALPSGTGPDVFWLNHPNAVSYLPTGHVMDLEPWAADIKYENFNERFYQPFVYQGKRYAVPFMWDDIVLFYNKAAFDQAGVAYPTADWTWDDYYGAAEKLTIKDGGVTTQYGVVVQGSMQSGAGPFIYQNGGSVYNADRTQLTLNTPEAAEAVQRQLDMINRGFAPTIQEVQESSADSLFISGAVAMMPGLSVRVSHFAEGIGDQLRVAPLPRQRRQGTIYHNIAYAAAAKTKAPDAVKQFLAFLATRRAAEIVSKTFAPCYSGMADRYFQEYMWADARYIPESINYGFPLPIASKNAGAVWTMVEDEMMKIYAAAGEVGNKLADMETLVNAEIAK